MKKLFSLIILTTILTSCGSKHDVINNEIEYQTYKVETWEISLWGEYNGVIESSNTALLSAKTPWKVVNLSKEVWDKVSTWELVARVDSDQAQISFTQAKDSLSYLQNLYSSTENSFDSQIRAMEEGLKQIQNNIKIAETNLSWVTTWLSDAESINTSRLEEAKKWIKSAEINLANYKEQLSNTISIYTQKEKDIYNSLKPAFSWTKITLENAMVYIDETYGITSKNQNLNDSFEDNISSKNPKYKLNVISEYKELSPIFSEWKKKIEAYSFDENNLKQAETYTLLKETETLLGKFRQLFDNNFKSLDNTTPGGWLNATALSKLKSASSTFQSKIEKSLINVEGGIVTWIKWSIQNIDNLNKQKQLDTSSLNKAIEAATTGLEGAKKSYETLKASTTWTINEITTKKEVSQTQIEVAKNELNTTMLKIDSLKAQKESNLNQIRTQIRGLKANQSTASVMINNANIYVPFAWVVTHKTAEVWEVKWAWMPIYTIADDKDLKVKVYIPESKIKEIKLNDKVNVYIKALNKSAEWKITKISPIVDASSKRWEVEIKISNDNREIKLWMYANITLEWKKVSWIKIPYNAIKYQYGEGYVIILDENSHKKKEHIKIEKCNQNFCVITWNITTNDKLINY